jgi:hypothetical protein
MQKLFIAVAIMSTMLIAGGCNKNEIKYGDFELVTAEKALLKVNFVSSYYTNPQINISLDGMRISNPISSRAPFPGGGLNTGGGSTADYLSLTPGAHTIKIAVPQKGTGNDSIKLYEASITVEAGKAQTLHITDTAASTTKVIFTDDRTRPDSGFLRYRFVNLMPNEPALDLYFGSTKVAENVAYKESKEFTMELPATNLPWFIHEAGAGHASDTLATYSSASTITNRRVYTIFALGYWEVVPPRAVPPVPQIPNTDPRRPFLSFLYNL